MSDISQNGLIEYYKAASGDSSLLAGTWNSNINRRFAFKVFSDYESLDAGAGTVSVKQPESESLNITEFSSKISNSFRSCVVANDGIEKVELCLDDMVVSLLVDQSGSMSWNDNGGLRHDILKRMVTRNASVYPGDISYNLFKFYGTPFSVSLFGTVNSNDANSSDSSAVLSSFFQDDEARFAGVRVVRKQGSYPSSPIDGVIVSDGFFSKILDEDLNEGEEYFYKIFAYDKNFHFSSGVPIKASPRSRIIPRGLSSVSSEVINGTGTIRDDNTVAIWHMGEKSGRKLFDFSDNKIDLTISDEEPVWLSDNDVPIGFSGLRLSGSTQISSSQTSAAALDNKATIMGWIYPFDITSNRIVFSRQTASSTNYQLITNSSGGISVSIDGTLYVASSTSVIEKNQWNHIAVSINLTGNEVLFYVNGVSAGTGSFASTATSSGSMFVDFGFDRRSVLSAYAGRITEFSFHDDVMSSSYISDAGSIPLLDDGTEDLSTERREDNGDRMVVFRYTVPDDYNYENGHVRIVKNEISNPGWEEDGYIVGDFDATPGDFEVTDTGDFVLGRSCSYRIFTKNSLGNYSYLSDSPLILANIPSMTEKESPSSAGELTLPLTPVASASAIPGNNKVHLKWKSPLSDTRLSRVEIYHSVSGFPVVKNSGESGGEGESIYSGPLSREYFVHYDAQDVKDSDERVVENGKNSYYTIVTRDKYGRVSNPVNLSSIPSSSASEIGIPITEVENIGYEIFNNNSLTVKWNNPISLRANIDAYLDDRVFVYSYLSDDFGRPISDDSNVSLKVEADVTFVRPEESSLEDTLDAFGESFDVSGIDINSLYSFSYKNIGNGVIRGSVRMTASPNILSLIKKATFTIIAFANIPDTESELNAKGEYSKNLYEFFSKPIKVNLDNPIYMDIENRDNRKVEVFPPCPESEEPKECAICIQSSSDIIAGFGFDSNEAFKTGFDGAYARSSNPFVARAYVSFRGEPVPDGTEVRVTVWDAAGDNVCDKGAFAKVRVSTTVLPPVSTLVTSQSLVENRDPDGSPNGEFELRSFVDIPLSVPRFRQNVHMFTRVEYNGYVAYSDYVFVFENPLRLSLSVRQPEIDGIDIAEQSALAYYIDPDNPSNRTPIRDGSVVRWSLRKKKYAKDRPFYSTDNVSNLTGGVFSKVSGGVARKVFFGPIPEVSRNICKCKNDFFIYGESYEISASVVYDGLSAQDSKPIELLPQDNSALTRKNRFLMEISTSEAFNSSDIGLLTADAYVSKIYADGEDYAKALIFSDPESGVEESVFSECFVSCVGAENGIITRLPAGLQIRVKAPGMEILWGNIIEYLDPYTNEISLSITDGGFSAYDSALVEVLDADYTPVWFRVNKFVSPVKSGPFCIKAEKKDALPAFNSCSCLFEGGVVTIPEEMKRDIIVIGGDTTLLIDERPKTFVGGGSESTGVPPTMVLPKEPLSIRFVQNRVDGVPSQTFILDGISKNELLFEVSFSGKKVPDGVEVTFAFQRELDQNIESKISLESRTSYTVSRLESSVNSYEERSYVSVIIDPVSAAEDINETLIATVKYDKSGLVEREINTCVNIIWQKTNNEDQESSVVSNSLYAYNTSSDDWISLAPMSIPRSYASFHMVSGLGYLIGGLGRSTVVNSLEIYDPASDSWSDGDSIPTARFGYQSVVYGGKIYVVGGLTQFEDSFGRKSIAVSRKNESYDTSTGNWTTLERMPIYDDGTITGRPYCVAFGSAAVVDVSGDIRIYVVCGINSINDTTGAVSRINDRILYYSINNDEWVISDEIEDKEMLQIYQRVSPQLFIDGGNIIVYGGTTVSPSNQEVSLKTDAFKLSTSTGVLSVSDSDFSTLPKFRYRGGSVSVGTDTYVMGGSDKCTSTLYDNGLIDTSSVPYSYTDLANIPRSRSAFGIDASTLAYAPYSGIPHVFVAGGYSSGTPSGLLKILTKSPKESISLDGRQSASIPVLALDESCRPPAYEIDVIVKGYLKFPEESSANGEVPKKKEGSGSPEQQKFALEKLNSRLAIYPVLFEVNRISLDEKGRGVITVLPRSDDILESGQEILKRLGISDTSAFFSSGVLGANEALKDTGFKIESGDSRSPYSIMVEITVSDSNGFYFGQTVDSSEVLQESGPFSESAAKEVGECRCDDAVALSGSLSFVSRSSGTFVSNSIELFSEANPQFNIVPNAMSQELAPVLPYSSDIDWIPTVESVFSDNSADSDSVINAIENAKNEIPFGASALFDTVVKAAEAMSDTDVDSISKSIYVVTDNEFNMSVRTIEEAIEEVNSIDGNKEVPVILGNFSVVFPTTISARANTTDTQTINRIALETNGQAISVLSSDFEDDYVGMFSSEVVGSIGYGVFDILVDMGSVSNLVNVSAVFDLYENTNGKWSISVSNDLFSWTDIDGKFSTDEIISLDGVSGRYVRFSIVLTSGLTASNNIEYESIPLPGSPALLSLSIGYEVVNEAEIYVNAETVRAGVQQVVVSVDASSVDQSDIKVGIASSNSVRWQDFNTPSNPAVSQFGKLFLPIRDSEDSVYQEDLVKVDKYSYRARFGVWDSHGTVKVYDSEGEEISDSEFKAYPHSGLIVFNKIRSDNLKVKISYGNIFRVGIKMTSRSGSQPLSASGFGFMYNTNVNLLPMIEKVAPVVSKSKVSPLDPHRYSVISATYEFRDRNLDKEDISQADISWYINGTRIAYLDGLSVWNDLSNPNDPIYKNALSFSLAEVPSDSSAEQMARELDESILKPGDSVYFTIVASDGEIFSNKDKSNIVTVSESEPKVSDLKIVGVSPTGRVSNTASTEDVVLIQFSLSSDSDTNKSRVYWFVNDELVKEGIWGETEGIDRMDPEEQDQAGNFALLMSNEIRVEIAPETGSASGEISTSNSLIIENTIPKVKNVFVGPSNPKPTQKLVLSFEFVDRDLDIGDANQSNQSTVSWHYADSTTLNEFIRVAELDNSSIVNSSYLKRGQRWKAFVTPFDGLDSGTVQESNTVTVR